MYNLKYTFAPKVTKTASIGKIFPILDLNAKLIYNNTRGEKMIDRKEYIEELKRWKDKDLIKVVTGIRRCGKSTLFEQFMDYLKEKGINSEQIIYINLEDADYDFQNYKELYSYISSKIEEACKSLQGRLRFLLEGNRQ